MSWQTFKSNLLQKMSSYPYEDNNGFAKALADEYDRCMKAGSDIVNKNRLKQGNKSAFQSVIESQQASGVASTNPAFYTQLFPLMGNAVKAYWAGAKLFETNPPILVTPPAVKNLYILPEGNIVINPGQFGNTSVSPIIDVESFLNSFIFLAKIHLTTISGICNTMAQYPPPAPPAPSVVNWTGYQVPEGQSDDEFAMSDEEVAGAKEDLKSAEQAATQSKSQQAKNSAIEAISFMRKKLAAKRNHALTDDNQLIENPPPPAPPADAEIGNKIVYYARLEIGKTENPLPPGKPENWGMPVQSYLKTVGINEPAFWCAAFVSTIYKSAGALSANSAGCDEWRAWAKKKGLWSRQPAIGAAILYGSEADAHHIGIVEKINGNSLTTIEGNTSGGGFNRNGVGVFRKKTSLSKALGFVIPQDKNKAKSTKK